MRRMELSVSQDGATRAVLRCGQDHFPVAVGSGGLGVKRAEGDCITPLGIFPVRRLLFRADRIKLPLTGLSVCALAPDDGWCDAPNDCAYNKQVKLPYRASAEALWRADPLYDLIVVLGYNDDPVVPGVGSAIFLHVAHADYRPTQGCIALARDDLLAVISKLSPGDSLAIRP
jgi:L,D-peptidoglycan transpeptidase YkuD (ErfK/YbiS/YcfS/YnhG family)